MRALSVLNDEELQDLVKKVQHLLMPYVLDSAKRELSDVSQPTLEERTLGLSRAAVATSMELLDGLLETIKKGIRHAIFEKTGIDDDSNIQKIDASGSSELNRSMVNTNCNSSILW